MIIGQILGIVGAFLVMIGVFAPLASVPVFGSVNLFELQATLAILMFVLAAVHLVFCVQRLWWALWITKAAFIAAVLFGIYEVWNRLAAGLTAPDPQAGEALRGAAQIEWGVAALVGGVMLALAASLPHPVKKKELPPAPVRAVPPSPRESSSEDLHRGDE